MRYRVNVLPLDEDRGIGLPAWKWLVIVDALITPEDERKHADYGYTRFQIRRSGSPLRCARWAYLWLAKQARKSA